MLLLLPSTQGPVSISISWPAVTHLNKNGVQRHKGFKTTLLIRTKQNPQIFAVIRFVKLQNDTQTTAKRKEKISKNEVKS